LAKGDTFLTGLGWPNHLKVERKNKKNGQEFWSLEVVRPPPWENPQFLFIYYGFWTTSMGPGSGSPTPKSQNLWPIYTYWGDSATPDRSRGWLSWPKWAPFFSFNFFFLSFNFFFFYYYYSKRNIIHIKSDGQHSNQTQINPIVKFECLTRCQVNSMEFDPQPLWRKLTI
jgi:hypothetical protein